MSSYKFKSQTLVTDPAFFLSMSFYYEELWSNITILYIHLKTLSFKQTDKRSYYTDNQKEKRNWHNSKIFKSKSEIEEFKDFQGDFLMPWSKEITNDQIKIKILCKQTMDMERRLVVAKWGGRREWDGEQGVWGPEM